MLDGRGLFFCAADVLNKNVKVFKLFAEKEMYVDGFIISRVVL